jgi:Tfp pilus assembly protein PilN
MSQVNLLPPEILERQSQRRRTYLVGAGALAVLVLIFGFYLYQASRLAKVDDEIAAQEVTNQGIQGQINDLADFATLQASAQASQQELNAAWSGEVSFSGLLMDISRVIPSDMVLDALSFQLTPADTSGGTATTANVAFVGNMAAGGDAASVETIANWLIRLESVKGWENPWVSNGALQENGFSYAISSTADLSDEVVTPRGHAATAGGTTTGSGTGSDAG